MLARLPNCAIHRISPKGEVAKPLGEALLAMGIGPGLLGGEHASLALIETAPDVWSVGDLNEFDCWHTGLLAECISASGVGVVGFILPPQVGGRRISQHVVMQEGDAFVPYDSIQDVQARHGELVVGHLWGPPGKDGYRTCSRCQCRWRPGLE